MTNKEKERIIFKRDLIVLLINCKIIDYDLTEEQEIELRAYKDYLTKIEENNFIMKQPPTFFKVNSLYSLLVKLYEEKN